MDSLSIFTRGVSSTTGSRALRMHVAAEFAVTVFFENRRQGRDPAFNSGRQT